MKQSPMIALAVVGLGVLAGCSSSSGGGAANEGDGGGSSSSGGSSGDANYGQSDLYGTWVLPFSGQSPGDWIVRFNSDNTFQLTWFAATSSTTSDEEIWSGTYVANNGVIAFTTHQWSCPADDPSSAGTGNAALDNTPYTFTGNQLTLIAFSFTNASLTQLYNWVPVSGDAVPGSTLTPTTGCVTNGAFVPGPLATVTN